MQLPLYQNITTDTFREIIIPLTVFIFGLISTLSIRRLVFARLRPRLAKTPFQIENIVASAVESPSILWCVLISASVALSVSNISDSRKDLTITSLLTILHISLVASLITLTSKVIESYSSRFNLPAVSVSTAKKVSFGAILIVGILILLEIWGLPTAPVLLFILFVAVLAIIALRDYLPNLAAGLEIYLAGRIKAGDFIRVDDALAGYVQAVMSTNTQIRDQQGHMFIIPNRRLLTSTLVNYGKPLKTAKKPLQFFTRVHTVELTGLAAHNLVEFLDVLRTVSESVIYFHTHRFIEAHQFLVPEPANDFVVWVRDEIRDSILADKLEAVDTFEFSSLSALKERLIGIVEEHVTQLSESTRNRIVVEGHEFHFMKSSSLVLKTPYTASNLREFLEALRKLSLGSLYFHMYEAVLRLGKGRNDFSTWLEESLSEPELATEIASVNPYLYTLEGLRTWLVQLLEARIK